MQLTDHFKLDEFITDDDRYDPTEVEIDHLYLLCSLALEPIRVRWGPVRITSGYRTRSHNKRIGGSESSQHMTARACDFLCVHAPFMYNVYRWITDDLKWPGQVFYYQDRGHIHIGLPERGIKGNKGIKE